MKATEGGYMNQRLLTVQNNHPLHYGECARYKCSNSPCIWGLVFFTHIKCLKKNRYQAHTMRHPFACYFTHILTPQVSIYQNQTVHTQDFHYMTLQDARICANQRRTAHSYKYVRSIIIWYLIPRWCHWNFSLT